LEQSLLVCTRQRSGRKGHLSSTQVGRAQVEREQFEQAGQVVERAAPVMGFARLGEN